MTPMTKQSPRAGVAFDPAWRSLLECAAIEVFQMMAGAQLSLEANPPAEPGGEVTAMVGLAGALCGVVTLRCSRPASATFASKMLGGDAASNPSMARDAMGELCNMVAGNFKAKISSLADYCMLSVPTVIFGEDYAFTPMHPHDEITLCLNFDGEPIWVMLVAHS